MAPSSSAYKRRWIEWKQRRRWRRVIGLLEQQVQEAQDRVDDLRFWIDLRNGADPLQADIALQVIDFISETAKAAAGDARQLFAQEWRANRPGPGVRTDLREKE